MTETVKPLIVTTSTAFTLRVNEYGIILADTTERYDINSVVIPMDEWPAVRAFLDEQHKEIIAKGEAK